jgi:hypothetical protein
LVIIAPCLLLVWAPARLSLRPNDSSSGSR